MVGRRRPLKDWEVALPTGGVAGEGVLDIIWVSVVEWWGVDCEDGCRGWSR